MNRRPPLILLLALGLLSVALGLTRPPRPEVRVTWTTASELSTAGFHVYRSDSRSGPFRRVSQALIPASNDPLIGGEHVWIDRAVEAGRTYYYQLEDVDTSGVTTRHGPTEVRAEAPPNWALWAGSLLVIVGLAPQLRAGRAIRLLRSRPARRSDAAPDG